MCTGTTVMHVCIGTDVYRYSFGSLRAIVCTRLSERVQWYRYMGNGTGTTIGAATLWCTNPNKQLRYRYAKDSQV